MKVVKITNESNLTQEQLGGKGFNLQKLIVAGLNVPAVYAVPTSELGFMGSDNIDEIKLDFPRNMNRRKKYAVRSSGVGEDGSENSFAGIFTTILDVAPQDVPKAVQKVYNSKDTSVTTMYNHARDAQVVDMAVVIQEMIAADYAGVAFSVNPIENDRRIGLIEMVKGVGESLVSGKVKPTSVRINKITGMTRVLQTGTNNIAEAKLNKILSAVSDALWKIEELYGQPIDIEWAYMKEKLYLLQARPITTLGGEG